MLSSSNVAGLGMLAKSYPFTGSEPSGKLTWDDTQATHATIISTFPGQPAKAADFVSGLAAPFMMELSGVLVFGGVGAFPLALQCAGLCQMYLYGVSSTVLQVLL